jgi:ABC-2 type transport system permease protein
MPLFTTIAFLMLLLISSGYMMGAVSEEKESRTIEVLVTSISTEKLMAGKVLGIVATSLTLLLAWTVIMLAGILVAAQAGVGWFSDLTLDSGSILASLAVAIPAYMLAAALMIAIGAMVTTTQEAQSVSAVFFILHLLPIYVGWIFANSPHHPLALLFSLLPFTALVTLGLRNLFTIVPTWQVAASVAVQTLCAVGGIWLAGRALRLGMLRYGQRLNWQALWKGKA